MSNAAAKTTAMWVLGRLRAAGHHALFAGGCVRDMLLGRRCSDYDIATDAAPEQVRRLFRHVLLVGAKFGVAMVIHNRKKVEVTTFRSDLSYTDGRRPEGVRFSTPREDAQRRDFTINGMFYDPVADEVIDYVGGRADLKAGIIRTIGRPDERFGEDYLRMIRAARFAVRLGFEIDPATAAALRKYAPHITAISGERILEELSKMLAQPSAADAMRRLEELHLAKEILPELFAGGVGILPSHDKSGRDVRRGEPEAHATAAPTLWPHAVARVEQVAARKDLTLTMGALLVELEPKQIGAIIRRWGGSNELNEAAQWFSRNLDAWRTAGARRLSLEGRGWPKGPGEGDAARIGPSGPQDYAMPLADFKRLMANPNFDRLRRLWRVRERMLTAHEGLSRRLAARAKAVDKSQISPTPLLGGAELKALGVAPGPLMGRVLKAVYDMQLSEQVLTAHEALAAAKRVIEEAR